MPPQVVEPYMFLVLENQWILWISNLLCFMINAPKSVVFYLLSFSFLDEIFLCCTIYKKAHAFILFFSPASIVLICPLDNKGKGSICILFDWWVRSTNFLVSENGLLKQCWIIHLSDGKALTVKTFLILETVEFLNLW